MAQWKGCALAAVGLLLVGATGCAYPISKEWRTQARTDLAFATVLQDPAPCVGAIVIWGGVIIRTENAQDATDVLVLETPLNSAGEPGDPESSRGRFIARTSLFLDPAIFATGRRVTVAGEIAGKVTRPIGGKSYTYPLLTIKQIHLWPIPTVRYYESPDYYPEYWDGAFFRGPGFEREREHEHEGGRRPGR